MVYAHQPPLSRKEDLAYIADCVKDNRCCSIVGASNIGKSSLLRDLTRPEIVERFFENTGRTLCFVYIDFNLMLQMIEQGFYELVLRTILTELRKLKVEPDLIEQVDASYRQVVEPAHPFQVALGFNEGITTLCEGGAWGQRLVLLFDELDEVFQGIDERVFLNLRALRDRYPDKLLYVTATVQPLRDSLRGHESSEFAELFAHNTRHLGMLNHDDILQAIDTYGQIENVSFSPEDAAFVRQQAGGHPGLLKVVCRILAGQAAPDGRSLLADHRRLREQLADDPNVRSESAKLWNNVAPDFQEALMEFLAKGKLDPVARRNLRRLGLLVDNEAGQPQLFGRLFENFVRRQRLIQEEPQQGVIIDIEAGTVYVDGEPTETLTSLEYRLLLLLYGHMDKICDKYRIVEAVWGEDYLEEVDDARIEKLVSRLRQKVEPNPGEPRYLQTIRGRGYRLSSSPVTK